MSIVIRKITEEDLAIAINFLKSGFKWSEYKSRKIRNFISKSNQEISFYGYFMIDTCNNKVYGAILTIFQGTIKSLKISNKNIINLSAWYVSPSKRGIKSVLFAQYIINDLIESDFLITDYTPSPIALKIFKRIGLSEMKINQRYYAFWRSPQKLFATFLKLLIRPYLFLSIVKSNKFDVLPKELKLSNVYVYEIKIYEKKSFFAVVKKIISSKRFGIKFYFPVLQILWIQDEDLFLRNWNLIRTLIHIKFKVLFIYSVFLSSASAENVIHVDRYFLIDNKNKDLVDGYVYPIGSELCIK